jgi:antitoxin Phd
MITMTSVEAQNRFGQLLDTVQREPVTITRHGRPAAFMVSAQDMAVLQEMRQKKAAAAFEAWSAQAAKESSPQAALLTDEEINSMVHALR